MTSTDRIIFQNDYIVDPTKSTSSSRLTADCLYIFYAEIKSKKMFLQQIFQIDWLQESLRISSFHYKKSCVAYCMQ